jgi:uncharacterized protein (TIGR01244 family)
MQRIPVLSLSCLLPFLACSKPEAAKPAPAPAPAQAAAHATPTLDLAQLQATQVKNIAMPAPGLVTAGQATEAQLEQLAKLGIKQVICLRAADEAGTGWEEAKAKQLGLSFLRLPVKGNDDVSVANAEKLAAALAASGGQPAMVCCGSSNRVGALLAMKAFHVDGKTADEALQFGQAAGLKAMTEAVQGKLVK